MHADIKAAAQRLLRECDIQAEVRDYAEVISFERDVKTVATWALGASAIEHVNCNAVKPCACRCSVCAVPEPSAPPTVAPHDAAKGA